MPFLAVLKKDWGASPEGGEMSLGRQAPRIVYDTLPQAEEAARELARVNPQTPVYIFEAVRVVETSAPTYVRKTFNASGELLPE